MVSNVQPMMNSQMMVIESIFPLTISTLKVNSRARDLADHLLNVVIRSKSPVGPTPDEIGTWVSYEAIKLPAVAFKACTNALELVLAEHPYAPQFLPELIAIRKDASRARKLVHRFEMARRLLDDLRLRNSVELFVLVGIPSELQNHLKKTTGDERWYPSPGLLGNEASSCEWGKPLWDRKTGPELKAA